MSQTPREAQFLIEQLEEELANWNRTFNVIHQNAQNNFHRSENTVNDFYNDVMVNGAQIDETFSELERVGQSVETIFSQANATHDSATQAQQNADSIYKLYLSTFQKWQGAEQRATHLVTVCQEAQSRAQKNVTDAQYAVNSASDEVSIAESNYSSCMNSTHTNHKGERIQPNCSAQAGRLSSAKSRLNQALSRLEGCRTALNQAITALNDALFKLRKCEAGLVKLDEAKLFTDQAGEHAKIATSSAYEASRWAEEAVQQMTEGQKIAENLDIQHQNCLRHTTEADDLSKEVLTHYYELEKSLNEYISRQRRARDDLSDAFESLRQINRKGI